MAAAECCCDRRIRIEKSTQEGKSGGKFPITDSSGNYGRLDRAYGSHDTGQTCPFLLMCLAQ